MRLYFLDTSALVKLYYQEKGSKLVYNILTGEGTFCISSLAYPELIATFSRKVKAKEININDFDNIISTWKVDYKSLFAVVGIGNEIIDYAGSLAEKYALKGADAIQLACAFEIKKRIEKSKYEDVDFILVSSDKELLEAGDSEGFETLNPEEGV